MDLGPCKRGQHALISVSVNLVQVLIRALSVPVNQPFRVACPIIVINKVVHVLVKAEDII
jgi:hypothetical protein